MLEMIEEKIEKILKKLTLDEKIGMIHGDGLFKTKSVDRLGIPAVYFSDGPMGVRKEFKNDKWETIDNSDDYVTYLPCNSAIAATWNRNIAYETGKVLGEEARGRGKDVILAPGINIKRSPLCGRNFEYMSEDPYLSGELAVPIIKGIQTADVAACVKHFALNNQETERLWVESEASERALHEIYLPAFKKAVEIGNVYSIMGAYNLYKGEHCCENDELLNNLLRQEWGFDGVIISDWGAVHDAKKASCSGLDIEMSVTDNFDEYCMAQPLKKLIEQGKISEEAVNEKVRNILRMMFRLNMIGNTDRKSGSYNTAEHRKVVLEAARESVVLLKNRNNVLPLHPKNNKNVLIIGDNANRIHSNGGGSAEVKALYEISPLMGIKMLLGGNSSVRYVQGYIADDMNDAKESTNWQADSLKNGGGSVLKDKDKNAEIDKKQKEAREEAVELAKEYDTVILFVGQNHKQDLEGHDRTNMVLPYGQDKLIEEVLDVNPNAIVVVVSGSPVEMPWIEKAKAIVWSWYGGMEGGIALAEILFGKVNPSGRLPETLPIKHIDCSAHCIGEFAKEKTVKYKEDIFVGYRYYDTQNIPVLFPFGYGLSYTSFKYDNLKIKTEKCGEKLSVYVSLDVTNTGNRSGKETIQIYVGKEESEICRANKELREFIKLELESKQTKKVELVLGEEAFSYFDGTKFTVEPGIYKIYICKSVADVCLEEQIYID